MFKEVGRIVTRAAGTDKSQNDGVLIGVMFRDGLGELKPYTVYTILSIEGTLVLREEGECSGDAEMRPLDKSKYQFNWGMRIDAIMQYTSFILTKAEYLASRLKSNMGLTSDDV